MNTQTQQRFGRKLLLIGLAIQFCVFVVSYNSLPFSTPIPQIAYFVGLVLGGVIDVQFAIWISCMWPQRMRVAWILAAIPVY